MLNYAAMTRNVLRLFRLAAVILLASVGPAIAGGKVVVELFTSQGCSSCPPADAFLRELSRRDDVIALSFHVDYWNYLGWRDPFAIPASTDRQRRYRAALGLRYVYTPQMVIGGTAQALGSGRDTVMMAISGQRDSKRLDVTVKESGPRAAIVAIGAGAKPAKPADIWAFLIDRERTTEIRRGENGGLKLVNANVVRAIRRIGEWTGARSEIRLDLAKHGAVGRDACVIVVQTADYGAILGATLFPLPKGSS